MSATLIQFPRRTGGQCSLLQASVGSVLLGIAGWRRRARSRRELIAADSRMLADLGISRAQAEFMALESRLNCNQRPTAAVNRCRSRPRLSNC
ncbi:MAG: DUF1127 domain-containing protein [Acetobacteraceae bacterium]